MFDEVISGFRVSRGGAQELYGVLPDLSILGKVVGGGLPAAAYGGPRVLMERVAPAGDVYQAGTLSGNPLAVAAARATLEQLDDQAYARLEEITHALATGLKQGGREAGVDRPGAERSRARDTLLPGGPVERYFAGGGIRPRRLRHLVPGLLGARGVPAGLPVRGVVPVARPQRGGDQRTVVAAARGVRGVSAR